MRAALAALVCLILAQGFAPPLAKADDDDQDEAHEAVEHGDVAPLAEVLARPELTRAGELVRVRLVHGDRRWTYQLRFVEASGRVRDIEVDATRGRGDDRPGRR